jgi:hypothetical protein
MKRELIIAVVFCAVGMTISFVPIMYKNNWTIFQNGHTVNLLGSK